VKATEHNAKTPTARSGFLAPLASLFPARGSGAPSHRPRLRSLPFLLVLVFLAPLAATAVAPAPAFASECSPVFGGSIGNGGAATPVSRSLTSVVLGGDIHGLREATCEAQWTIQWSAAGPSGPWQEFPGGTGTVTGAGGERAVFKTGELTGLEPETLYYTRGILKQGSRLAEEEPGNFEAKPLRPFGANVEVESASITESSAHLKGAVSPAPFETHWRLEYSASKSALGSGAGTLVAQGTITQAEAEALQAATGANSAHLEANLTGLSPNTTYYLRAVAEDEPEWPPSSGEFHHKELISSIQEFETHGPPVAEASATPALRGETMRVLGYVVPHGFDTHYRFQYEATAAAADLPGLQPGQTYHYRIIATSPAAAGVTVPGADHTLTVPVPAEPQPPQPCENETLRTAVSARLPDCRAYEQVTPAEKGGAQQAFSYSNQVEAGALVGEDGDHLALEQPFVHWGSGQSPYFFSRTLGGWQMTPGRAQPEAGLDTYAPQLVNPDLTRFAFAAGWKTGVQESPNLEFKAGIPGGPYPTAASVPRAQAELNHGSLGWVAASDDFSKLILATTDRTLAGPATATAFGADLYEYAEGALRQLNVTTPGATIGKCGATVVNGFAERTGGSPGQSSDAMGSSRHTISTDGTRVFFEAVPSASCSEPPHLYMRTGGGAPGAQTVDIGAYRFLAANASGTELLLEAPGAETQQILLYATATATAKPLLTLHEHHTSNEQSLITISEDFSTIYLQSRAQLTPDSPPPTGGEHVGGSTDLYRYDIAAESLHFVVQSGSFVDLAVTPDGRDASWEGLLPDYYSDGLSPRESMLYDGAHNFVECVSCASPFNPEPSLPVAAQIFGNNGVLPTRNGAPKASLLAADGHRFFFDTRSTLLPADVDGESPESSSQSGTTVFWSPSSDVYEWRANGVEGCTHVQGCLALVSSGRGGYLVQLLGADSSGRDVFFTTQEQLTPNTDTDTSIDIYDARSGGGFPPQPPGPVECEGDACSTPFAAPSDLTPSSSSFQGAGNLLAPALPEVKPTPKPKPRKKCKTKAKKKCKAKAKKKSATKARRGSRNVRRTGRAGR